MAMLEGLSAIDWKSRNAEQVPVWIRGLASHDRPTRVQAFNDFETDVVFGNRSFEEVNFMWGLSDILQTDVPVLVVPFLIELLEDDQVPQKANILYFLHRMALYVEFHDAYDAYLERARQVRSAIWEGLDIYLELLDHPDPMVRTVTIELLTLYGEHGQQVFTNIVRQLKCEQDVKTIVIALKKLNYSLVEGTQLPPEVLSEYGDLLQGFFAPRYEDAVRLAAAVFFIENFRHSGVAEAVTVVREVMESNPDQEASPFNDLSGLYPFWSKVSAILALEK